MVIFLSESDERQRANFPRFLTVDALMLLETVYEIMTATEISANSECIYHFRGT